MGTLSSLLNLSQNALIASQAAIGITANNVANSNTVGYAKQIAVWQENDTVSISPGVSVGEGANVTSLSQRDPVLNQRVQQQTQLESSSSAESAALQNLQSIFSLSSTITSPVSTTLDTDMNAFFNSLTSLEANPSNTSVRRGVLNAATTLASDFNGAANQIAQQTTSLNQQVLGVVSKVNSLTASIAALNLQIQSNSPNADAGTLEDQRQQDLTQLSQYISFDQTKTESNGLTLSTANGALLVSQGQSFALTTSVVNGNVDVISSAGNNLSDPTILLSDGSQGTGDSLITGGSLGGILKARDQDLPTVSTALDSLAYAIGTAVNTQNNAGVTYAVGDVTGTKGGDIFTLPTTSLGAASTIAVAISDPSLIAAAGVFDQVVAGVVTPVNEGSSGNTNATALAAIANANLLGDQTASSFYAFYASLLTQVGSTAARVADQSTTQQASLTQLTTLQSSQSSVSLDQEAANLSEFQRSYQAAAKIFSIVDQLMASALNLGQQTTVS